MESYFKALKSKKNIDNYKTLLIMTKLLFLSVLFISHFNINTQNNSDSLVNINTLEEAEKFAINNPELSPEVFKVYPEIDTVKTPDSFRKMKAGDIVKEGENLFKAISLRKVKIFRVNYIYLDGNKLSTKEIEKLRSEIISKYKKGTKFLDLVKEYTMDGNKSGDLDWFPEGMTVTEFENSVKNHKKDEIFTVDVLENKWFYVVLKSFNDREINEIEMIKIKNNTLFIKFH
jgi:parvulin-like peptidyl-prolyl isomerase